MLVVLRKMYGVQREDIQNPAPSAETVHVVHLTDAGSQKTTKSTSQRSRREEERITLLSFHALVPHADEVEAPWEHAGLSDTEEETGYENASIVLDEALAHGDETKAEHTAGEPHVWAEFLEEDVGWDFEENICYRSNQSCAHHSVSGQQLTNEEDGKDNVVLVLVKAKIILETEGTGVGDVDTINEGEEVEDAETRHDVPVYPAEESGFCGVGWALDEDGLTITGVGGGVWLLDRHGALLISLRMLLGRSNL